jgi:hypothetical protein
LSGESSGPTASPPTLDAAARAVAVASCVILCALILVAAGQPLFTDDLWWHLALGQAHLREGPWLSADPLLFTAPGPPAPAAWLSDLLFAGAEALAGFTGLRVLHVALVGGCLGLSWSILRRASGSALAAWLGTSAFGALAAYRLVQLRPHLFSLLALLLLYKLLFESERPLGWWRIFATGALMALWVNLHSGFVLGLVLPAGALGWLLVRHRVSSESEDSSEADVEGSRMRGLAAAGAAGAIGSLLNPAGIGAYAPYLRAGSSTPSLGRVGDEWTSLGLLTWPAGSQPSLFVWIGAWLLLLGLLALVAQTLVRQRRGLPARVDGMDLVFAAIAFGFMALAVRFVWLSILPLIAFARAGRVGFWSSRAASWAAAGVAMAILVGFLVLGDWRGVTRFLPSQARDYARPYPALKYHAHAVWLLQDARLEGRLFNEYHLGGFLGYWLAPGIQTFLNGSLNVSREAIEANWPLRHRRGVLPGETFLEALDRFGIDLFMGIRTPSLAPGAQPWVFTSGHLERSEGWTLGFRNLLTSLYVRDVSNVRDGGAGESNLDRLDAYYRRTGVPFDPAVGFEPARVIREAPLWARRHGVVPVDFDALERAVRRTSDRQEALALDRLASIYSILREHAVAVDLDQGLLQFAPGALRVRRRLAWNLLHQGRAADALAVAAAEEMTDFRAGRAESRATDPLLDQIAALARDWDRLEPEERAARLATQPFLTPADASRALAGFLRPPARARRE